MDRRSRTPHMSRREFLVLSGAVAGTLSVTRSGTDSALAAPRAQAAPGGTLAVGHIGDVDNYDPLTDALDQFQNYGRLLIFSNLTAYDAESALVGDLATAWELDGTSWVFTLRDGVTWHDGSPFTADDVKYTFERILDPEVGSFAVPFIGEEATVEVVDPLTARSTFPSVNASFPDLMTAVSIVKKDSGEANRDQPIGTGPFKFESWSPNEETVYVRNDSYYDPSRPLLDSIVFRPIPDPQVAVTNLTAGSVQLVSNQLILPQTAQSLEGSGGRSARSRRSVHAAGLREHGSAGGAAHRQASPAGTRPLPRSERGQRARLCGHRHADKQFHGAVDLGLHRPAKLRVRSREGEEPLRRGWLPGRV